MAGKMVRKPNGGLKNGLKCPVFRPLLIVDCHYKGHCTNVVQQGFFARLGWLVIPPLISNFSWAYLEARHRPLFDNQAWFNNLNTQQVHHLDPYWIRFWLRPIIKASLYLEWKPVRRPQQLREQWWLSEHVQRSRHLHPKRTGQRKRPTKQGK